MCARLMRARAQMVGLGDDNAPLVVMLLVVTPMSQLLLLAAELQVKDTGCWQPMSNTQPATAVCWQ